MSRAWLVAGALVVAQVLSSIQILSLRDRVVQIEAGVEFWEYGMGGCTAPSTLGRRAPGEGGLVAYRPGGTV